MFGIHCSSRHGSGRQSHCTQKFCKTSNGRIHIQQDILLRLFDAEQVASCSTSVYHDSPSQTSPPGCLLDGLNDYDQLYQVTGTMSAYVCQPTDQPILELAFSVVAYMSCKTAVEQFTKTVTASNGPHYTICAASSGTTNAYANGTTLAVFTLFS